MPADLGGLPQAASLSANLADAGLHPVQPFIVPQGATVLRVGAGQAYQTLASALADARDGAVLLVDAGTYADDFATVRAKVSIVGVGGMVNLVATTPPSNGKAILCVDTDCTMENIAFSGCRVPDQNGAGIRYEGGNLTLRNCSFHDNENGLLSAPVADGVLLIQHCDFSRNGNGNGLTHNLYVGGIKQLTVEGSRFSDVVVGHEIKSRAATTIITGNVIADGPDSTASYSIDLPNGGSALVSGNLIEKGPQAENTNIIHFGGEGIPYAGSGLRVEGNQVTNDRGPGAVAVLNHTAIPVTITGNSFTRLDPARIAQGPARISANLDSPDADGAGALLSDAVLAGVLPGRTQVFSDALDHQVTMVASDTAVQGGAGRLQVLAAAGHVIVQGGAGGLDFSESPGSGGNQVTTSAGSANSLNLVGQDLLDSEGSDTITTGEGNVTGQVGGDAAISEGSGNNQWNVVGTAHLTGHGGAPRIGLGSAASIALDGALSFFAISSNGGTATCDVTVGDRHVQASLSGGAFNAYHWDGRTGIATAAGADGVRMRLGAGDFNVVSAGRDVIQAGDGDTMVQASGAAEVYAGAGALALYGRGWSGASLWGAGGTYLISGDTGGITYHGGDQASTVQAELSNITLLGGAGHLTVQAGSRQAIIGGPGGLTLTETTRSGANRITTTAGSTNDVTLNGDSLDSWGRDTISELGANDAITVHGDALIRGGAGNSNITVTGRATLLGQGGDWVTLAPGASATMRAGAYLSVGATQATLRLAVPAPAAPAATALIEGSARAEVSQDRVMRIGTGAGGGTRVTVDGGASSIETNGADQIRTGTGTAYLAIGAAGTEVWAGSGQLDIFNRDWTWGDRQTIHGGDGLITLAANYGAVTFIGGAGDAILDGTGSHLAIQGGSGRITLIPGHGDGGGAVDFTGGSGDAVLDLAPNGGSVAFGSGSTTVHQAAWGQSVTYAATGATTGLQAITGFRPGTDTLHLQGTQVAAQTAADGTTTLTTTSGASIRLEGVASPVPVIVDAMPVPPVPAATTAVDAQAEALALPGQPASVQRSDATLAGPTQPAQAAAGPAFAVTDTATGQALRSEGETYLGPVTSLQRQFIWSGTGGVVVTATTPDVFLHGGAWDDALSTNGGSNVLDGGAGSNFLVGGSGTDGGVDTFFVDGRGGQTWSTVVNFHHGDAFTLWGFQPGVSTLPWAADEGADGYRGATLHSELAGAGTGVGASATFAGLTVDDVNTKLTTTSGTVGGLSYLNIAYTG